MSYDDDNTQISVPEAAINLYNELIPVLANYTNGDTVWAFGLVMLMIGKSSEPENIDRALLRLAVIAKSNIHLDTEMIQ